MAKLFIVGKTFKLKKRIILVGNSVVNNNTKSLLQKNFQITEVSAYDLKDHIKHTNYGCTGDHSLNYRLGGNEGSVTKEFFDHGNKVMYDKYKKRENFPWLSQSL